MLTLVRVISCEWEKFSYCTVTRADYWPVSNIGTQNRKQNTWQSFRRVDIQCDPTFLNSQIILFSYNPWLIWLCILRPVILISHSYHWPPVSHDSCVGHSSLCVLPVARVQFPTNEFFTGWSNALPSLYTVQGVPKSGVAPPWRKSFSLMKTMRCLRISRDFSKQKQTKVPLSSHLSCFPMGTPGPVWVDPSGLLSWRLCRTLPRRCSTQRHHILCYQPPGGMT